MQHEHTQDDRRAGSPTQPGMPSPVVRRITPAAPRQQPVLRPGAAGYDLSGVPTAIEGLTVHHMASQLPLSEGERAIVDAALPELTRREREVLYEICAGGTNEAVAERIGVKLPTLRTHLMRLNQKLGSTSKSDLVRLVTQVLLISYRGSLGERSIAAGSPRGV